MKEKTYYLVIFIILGIIVIGSCKTENSIEADLDNFVGLWLNDDSNTRGITKVQIRSDATYCYIHAWGKCHPIDCDWGESSTELSDSNDNKLIFYWDPGFCEINQVVEYLGDNQLKITTNTHFTDDSGRKDYEKVEFFTRK